MDDPLFDPWGLDDPDAPAPAEARPKPRWRSPEGAGPTVPEARQTSPPADTAPPARMPRSRLTGTRGFLRTMAVPRLEETALRLTMARHDAQVEDLLDDPAPLLRLTLRPWSSPLSDEEPREGHLEIGLEDLDQEYVTVRSWLAEPGASAVREDRIATTRITSSWLDSRLLDFIGLVLDQA